MQKKQRSLSKDLQGAGRLTVEAITGITDIVESLHQKISNISGRMDGPGKDRTKGITGLVYRNIRTVTELVGTRADSLLNRLEKLLGEQDSSPGREAVLSALNGILGDHLVARNNPLAIPMQIRLNRKTFDGNTLSDEIPKVKGRIAIMVHGSCMNSLQWNRHGHDHGAALKRDIGLMPVYVDYNTGLHISENGKQLANLLDTIFESSNQAVDLFMISHSMGGLVSRSACYYGKKSGHSWLKHLKKLMFLGTPHHGSLLEKGGNWIDMILEISPYSAPFSRLGKIRSSGITDLRYGNVVEEDWANFDRFDFSGDRRIPVPLPNDVQCYAIAAATSKIAQKMNHNLIGDGLVTVNSALGLHDNPQMNLSFPKSHRWIGCDMNHWDLLNHPEVYKTILMWLNT